MDELINHRIDDGHYLCQPCPDRLLARLIGGGQFADGHQSASTESNVGGLLDLRDLEKTKGLGI